MGNTEEHAIASIEKNSREHLKVGLTVFKGYRLLATRVWVQGDDRESPTKAGFNVQVGLIKPLREALERAEAKAAELGWLDEAS